MRILAFDTAANFCCALLMVDGKLMDKRLVPTERDQAKILAPMTQELLQAHNLTAKDIDRFAITTGPGSFTGLRVGLAFARGLGLATGKPVLGIDHFRCTARAVNSRTDLLIVRDSKRDELFACWQKQNELSTPFLAKNSELTELLRTSDAKLCGDGATHIIQHAADMETRFINLPPESCALSAAHFAHDAKEVSDYLPHPVYLRDADVSMPKKRA